MQENKQVIGERAVPPKRKILYITGWVLAVLAVLILAVGIAGIFMKEDASFIGIMIGGGVIIAAGSAIVIVTIKKEEQIKKLNESKPTITLNEDTLTLYLGDGTTKDVKLDQIDKIKFVPRQTATFEVLFITYTKWKDGILLFSLVDGTKVKVNNVLDAEDVKNKIMELKNQNK